MKASGQLGSSRSLSSQGNSQRQHGKGEKPGEGMNEQAIHRPWTGLLSHCEAGASFLPAQLPFLSLKGGPSTGGSGPKPVKGVPPQGGPGLSRQRGGQTAALLLHPALGTPGTLPLRTEI